MKTSVPSVPLFFFFIAGWRVELALGSTNLWSA